MNEFEKMFSGGNLKKEAAIGVYDDKDIIEGARIFKIYDEKDELGNTSVEHRISVRNIGTFDKLLSLGGGEFKSARELVDIFSSAKVTIKTPSGEIEKTPKLLVVGGWVRDRILGKKPKDLDFATSATYEEAKEILSNHYGNRLAFQKKADSIGNNNHDITATEEGEAFRVLRIRYRATGEEYEIATFRKDGDYSDGRRPDSVSELREPGEDAKRRDLTLNALFYNPRSGNVIDYSGGLHDMEQGVLRFVGDAEKRIGEDQLRILRYIRFLQRTDFMADPNAIDAIQKNAHLLKNIPSERITDEMDKLFSLGKWKRSVELLRETGVLGELLPDVEALALCSQTPPFHLEGDALIHTELLLGYLEKNFPNSSKELIWAAILHDIGKPDSRKETESKDGIKKVNFIGHDSVGAAKIETILGKKGLRFSSESLRRVRWLVAEHQFPLRLTGNAPMKIEKVREKFIEVFLTGFGSKGDVQKCSQDTLSMMDDLEALAIADVSASWRVERTAMEKNEFTLDLVQSRDIEDIQRGFEEAKSWFKSELDLMVSNIRWADGNKILEIMRNSGMEDRTLISEVKKKFVENLCAGQNIQQVDDIREELLNRSVASVISKKKSNK